MLLSPLRLLLFLLAFATAGPLFAQNAPFIPDEKVYYGIAARSSGRSLDVANSSLESGAAIVQWEFMQAPSQQWRFVRVMPGSDYFRIEGRQSGKCLTVDKPDENAPLVQRPYTGSLYQQWRLVPGGPAGSLQLISKGNDRCISVASADKANGTPIVSQKPANRDTQQWRLFKLRLNVDASLPGFGPPQPLTTLNTAGNELQPVLAPDNATLFFVRTKFAGNMEGNAESGDIWMSRSIDQGRTWNPATRFDALNTPQHNGVMAVVKDGYYLLVRGYYERDGTYHDDGISRAARNVGGKNGNRTEQLDIIDYYSTGTATTFFQTNDEKTLLLSLERTDGYGGNDIYISQPIGKGSWSEPRNLGDVVNSPGFEFAPWLSPDGKTLYFSSYGHGGYGSADIFATTRLDNSWTKWSEPRNLGPTLNGPGFDAYFSLTPDGKQAYYAASRTANGPADLFRVEVGVVPPDSVVEKVPAPTFAVAPPRALLTGRVVNAKTQQSVAAEVKVASLGGNFSYNATARVEAGTGSYQFTLPPGRYRLSAVSGGFLTATDTLTVTAPLIRNLLLVPAGVGSRLELPTLIFAQGKYNLLGASYAELNRLAGTLTDNPTVNIRLEGHTDNQGNTGLNQKLSEDRVAEVKRYLVSRGVAEDRISTVGYGGTKPRASNAQEETRRLNRRVEFTITKE